MPHINAVNYDFPDPTTGHAGNDPLSWGIDFTEAEGEGDWLFDSDDLTVEQATQVAELLCLYWPTVEHVHQALNDCTIDRVDKIVAAIKAGVAFTFRVIHRGSSAAVYRATATDIVNGWAMTKARALEIAHGEAPTVYDYGTEFCAE